MKSIRSKILLAVLVNVLIVALLVGGIGFYGIYKLSSDNINQLEKKMLDNYDAMIKQNVEILITELTAIKGKMDAGVLTKKQGEEIAAEIVRQAKYGESGYFWADTTKGINVVLLGNAEVEGTSRIDLTDVNGVKIIQEFMRMTSESGSGYLDYDFPF